MADRKKTDNNEYQKLRQALEKGNPECGYVFFGEERYLLENALSELRRILLPDGTDGFNYFRFDGGTSVAQLRDAVDMLPVMNERTLVEVWDYAFTGKGSAADKTRELTELLASLPEYVCLVFVSDVVEWKPDRRVRATADMLKHLAIVEFTAPQQGELVKWIRRHFKARGREISPADAEYLISLSAGYMTALLREIEKLASYRETGAVTREDIDALVEPAIDAKLYTLTDAIAERRFDRAFRALGDIIESREAPQLIIATLSRQLRRIHLARLYLDGGRGIDAFMADADVKQDWQARRILSAARGMTAEQCRRAVLLCCDCALALNSGGVNDDLTLLVARLAS
jgi:DNA polymerase-3 subunit delta